MGYLGAAFWLFRIKNYLDNSTYLLFGQYFLQLFVKNQAIFLDFCICLVLANRGESAYCYFYKICYKNAEILIFCNKIADFAKDFW